jgi:hypothetical protein
VTEDMLIVLRNYDCLVEHVEGVFIDWERLTLVHRDQRSPLDILTERGFTPATADT